MNYRNCLTIFAFIAFFGLTSAVYAQEVQRSSGVSTQCGDDPIEGEFTANFEDDTYIIDIKAGDSLTISLEPLGKQLNSLMFITGPTGLGIAVSSGRLDHTAIDDVSLEGHPKLNSDALSASGKYTIHIVNFDFGYYWYDKPGLNDTYSYLRTSGGIGVYSLNVVCTLRDGTIVNSGDISNSVASPTPSGTSSGGEGNFPSNPFTSSSTTFSGTGFPGLAPIDFANAFTNELTLGQPAKSKIPPSGDAVLGYTFDAAANDTLALSFTRVSGNLNLGLVVLSADNKVVFQASLVTSSELTTKFTLPSAGTYTIGIFRIDLLPPDAPEATAFQLTATLNP